MWALLGLALALAIGGGMLYAAGLLPSRPGNSGSIATAQPTEAPAPTAAPTVVLTAPPQPTSAPTTPATAVAQPTAAPTSAPTSTTAPSKTPLATKTPNPTATVAPTATTAPSATPTITSVPTETPRPTSDIPLQGGFKMLLEQNQGLASTLGAPLEAEQGGLRTTTEQQFENGSMFFFEPTGRIYVLVGDGNGTFRKFERQEMQQLPAPPAPPENCTQPQQGGFALIWGNFPDIQKQLGCPIAPEPDLFDGAYQPFEGGTLLWSTRGLGRGPTIYALRNDGIFERFNDPNHP
jgi:hypothetical protein